MYILSHGNFHICLNIWPREIHILPEPTISARTRRVRADMVGEGRIWISRARYEGRCWNYHVIIYLSHTCTYKMQYIDHMATEIFTLAFQGLFWKLYTYRCSFIIALYLHNTLHIYILCRTNSDRIIQDFVKPSRHVSY